jgi:hypothetical protein
VGHAVQQVGEPEHGGEGERDVVENQTGACEASSFFREADCLSQADER